ncbi:tripartite motif-containing protein 60-like [Erinaceus europaeus]|uniref:Tripartite motif-containing protein 60-like n=1 Tax=Erinaceus europaeus TaxID=9365 RepID=A0ABM3WEX1_ERIEU|nr:tripartite motif-containing protein 60-like [Erinaceus europaeus]
MDLAAFQAKIQAEISCPVCLGYLTDPVTLDCGHNFCEACIQQHWEGLQDVSTCPLCLHTCPDRHLKRNNMLCQIIDIVRRLPPRKYKRKREEEMILCEKHNQELVLFCEEDLNLLCDQCSISEHQHHTLKPAGHAAAPERKKLQSSTDLLKKQVDDAKMGHQALLAKSVDVRTDLENWRRALQLEVEASAERKTLTISPTLSMQQKALERKLRENKSQLSEHLSTLRNLLHQATEQSSQSEQDFLKNFGGTHTNNEHLRPPAVSSQAAGKVSCSIPPNYFGLSKIFNTFQVDLNLDLETAYPTLIISSDRKSVAFGRIPPFCLAGPLTFTSHPAVLSCEGFDSDVFLHIGVFLDCELRQLSFFNLDSKSCLYRFTNLLPEKLMPYFSTICLSCPLTLSILTGDYCVS